MGRTTNILTAAGVGLAGVVGGGILAASATATAADTETDAGDSSSLVDRSSGVGGQGHRGGGPGAGTPVDADVEAQVEAAVLAAYDGATVDRVHEEDADDGQPVYEAHVTTADGERVHVLLDDSFTVTGEEERGERRGAHRGPRGGAVAVDETTATQVQEAVAAAYDGATADRVVEVRNAEGETMYLAHVSTDEADSGHLHVLLDADFTVVDERERPARGERAERGADELSGAGV